MRRRPDVTVTCALLTATTFLSGVIPLAAATQAAASQEPLAPAAQEPIPPPPPVTPAPVDAEDTAVDAGGDAGEPWFEFIAGYEGDTHGTGYGFAGPAYVHPLRPRLAFTARVFASYLVYEFEEAGGTRKVRSPGVNPSVGLRFGATNFVQLLAGLDVRRREDSFEGPGGVGSRKDRDTRVGASFGAEWYTNPSDRDNVHALVNYGTVDKYTWARLGYKRQLTNVGWQEPLALFGGVEVIGQGNDDIRSMQAGPLVELNFVRARTALMLRGGYKRSTFDAAPDRSGPYFGIGLYKRF